MTKNSILYILPLILILFQNCDIINPEEPIASFIEINEVKLSHEDPNGIKDVWVDVNGNLIGVFELPAKFPVLAEGLCNISITPGIKVNGINEQRTFYPFYNIMSSNLTLTPGEVTVLDNEMLLTTDYNYDWVELTFEEDFETTNKLFRSPHKVRGQISSLGIENYNADSFKGSNCGAIKVDYDTTFFQIQTEEFSMPILGGTPGMYLELNFKTTTPALIGFYVFNGSEKVTTEPEYIVELPVNNEWTKVYIDLYNHLIQYQKSHYTYAIVINNYGLYTNSNSLILLDNIKIVQSKES